MVSNSAFTLFTTTVRFYMIQITINKKEMFQSHMKLYKLTEK